jgi:hypothetical protein
MLVHVSALNLKPNARVLANIILEKKRKCAAYVYKIS